MIAINGKENCNQFPFTYNQDYGNQQHLGKVSDGRYINSAFIALQFLT
jgi:hypothetical protein